MSLTTRSAWPQSVAKTFCFSFCIVVALVAVVFVIAFPTSCCFCFIYRPEGGSAYYVKLLLSVICVYYTDYLYIFIYICIVYNDKRAILRSIWKSPSHTYTLSESHCLCALSFGQHCQTLIIWLAMTCGCCYNRRSARHIAFNTHNSHNINNKPLAHFGFRLLKLVSCVFDEEMTLACYSNWLLIVYMPYCWQYSKMINSLSWRMKCWTRNMIL